MATFKDGQVRANGLRFHYVDWGSRSAPPLLCLHGITQTAHSWDEVAAALSSEYRVICLDQRGHGDSDWAPNGEYNRRAMAGDIDAISDELGLSKFLLCGMSMGGINSITFSAAHPEKVRALVIVDVSPEIKTEGVQNIRSFITASDELDSFEAFVERAHQFNPRRSLENIRSRLSHNLKQLPSGKWTWKYDKALRSGGRGFDASGLLDLWDDVARIRAPTLIVKGAESDILSADSAAKLQAAIPGSRLAEIPGAGHSVMGDNPEAFVAAVRGFLAEAALRP
jgi:pimeloyl-ACP methyl ester carboxylesterase